MPIEKPNIDPEFKQFAQKRVLRLFLIIGAILTGVKGVGGVINGETDSDKFPIAHSQPYNENNNQSQENLESEFIIETINNKRMEVYRTGGDGLLLRKEPGKDAEFLRSAFDGDSFLATGKSAEADGHLWYQIKDDVSGQIYWAASDWLKPINN